MIKVGSGDIGKLYVGSTEIAKAYVGSQLVYDTAEDDPYIVWLKSLGCICYLPLGSEGDLQDRISKKSLMLTGNGSLTWVSSVGMYMVSTPGVNSQYVAFLDNGMNENSFPNNCFTTLTSFQKITTSGFSPASQISIISTVSDTKVAINPLYNGSGNVSNYPSGLLELAVYMGADERNYYQQGALYGTYSAYAPYLPSGWSVSGDGLAIGMVRDATSSYFNKQFYLKDVYIFNTKLTLAQIRQIEGYD